ncbi:MAG: ABC transporter substrate-binding protein [Dehalococcoidales bacterium]
MKAHIKSKIFNALLALVMLVSLIAIAAGCGGSETTTPATTTPTTTQAVSTTPPQPANPEIIMASTTSTRDSGLMDYLIPIFEQQTGYKVKPVYVGSGAAIALAQKGNADVLLVHSPAAEVKFMSGNFGINRTLIMHNDFIIVGPTSDPAGIKNMTSATEALKKISTSGANFYSRGDNSGTDALEKSLWKKISITVADNSSKNPSWYIEGGTGTGMLDLLRIASEKNGYTITDRATYLANKAVLALDVLVQGDPVLLNIYHVIMVNPAMFSNVNSAGAKAFLDFMISAATQELIKTFGVDKYGAPLFFPDAGKTEASLGSV